MITYILIAIASIFKAAMDTFADHFSVSIFKNLNPNFWNKQVSWQGKKFLGIEVLDAWHIAQYIFLSLMFAAIYAPFLFHFLINGYDFFIYWAIYFVVFELFYDVIFKL
jgi:hypothetical protein